MSGGREIGHLEATTHGRYLLRAAGGPSPLVVGFHGYGENAEANLEAMTRIPGIDGWHLAAVQALHPFYNTRTGEVLASWMTRLDRELAIADNVRYVAAAVAAICARLELAGPLVLLGFSQGAAMAYRAAALSVGGVAGLVAIAGDMPPELAAGPWRSRPRVLVGRGTADEWYSAQKMEADLQRLAARGLEVASCVSAGGHEWSGEIYDACAAFLAELAAVGEPGAAR